MSESEQAQAIAEIKAVLYGGEYARESYRNAIHAALLVVDSQAQKIKHQQAEINVKTTMLNDMNELCAEQANEIGRLKSEVSK